jgi:hypothetical protein
MAIAYVCVDPRHTGARKAAWEASLANEIQWTNGIQLQDFEDDWRDLCQWPGPLRDVTWTTDRTKPRSVTSISLKIAISIEDLSETLFEITYRLKPDEQVIWYSCPACELTSL